MSQFVRTATRVATTSDGVATIQAHRGAVAGVLAGVLQRFEAAEVDRRLHTGREPPVGRRLDVECGRESAPGQVRRERARKTCPDQLGREHAAGQFPQRLERRVGPGHELLELV
ncbi:MAG: hypothetical protein ACRD0P_22910 [Stackebrandtia sp.]